MVDDIQNFKTYIIKVSETHMSSSCWREMCHRSVGLDVPIYSDVHIYRRICGMARCYFDDGGLGITCFLFPGSPNWTSRDFIPVFSNGLAKPILSSPLGQIRGVYMIPKQQKGERKNES